MIQAGKRKKRKRSEQDATLLHQSIFEGENGELVSLQPVSSGSKDRESSSNLQENPKKSTTLSRLAPIEPSKPSTTPSEYSENSEYSEKSPSKNSSRKATVAKAMGKIFGLDIDIIDNDANLTGDQARAKGWYDTETGKITVVLPKNNGIANTVRTISKPPKPSKPPHHAITTSRNHDITTSRHR